jgi:hypothetical protein
MSNENAGDVIKDLKTLLVPYYLTVGDWPEEIGEAIVRVEDRMRRLEKENAIMREALEKIKNKHRHVGYLQHAKMIAAVALNQCKEKKE